MQIDPVVTFWIGIVTTICMALSQAGIWTGALPADYIPIVAAWNNILGIIGTAIMTALTGVASSAKGPLTK